MSPSTVAFTTTVNAISVSGNPKLDVSQYDISAVIL